MKTTRWAVIGAGGIADRRAIPGMLLDPQNELVAVMDLNAATAEKVAAKYNVPHWFTNAEEMLDSVTCDAVYIATPVFSHYTQAMMALGKGVHVFMEKPISLNYAEGLEILETAKKAGMLVCGVYDDSSKEYETEIREVSDFYVKDFSELLEIDF